MAKMPRFPVSDDALRALGDMVTPEQVADVSLSGTTQEEEELLEALSDARDARTQNDQTSAMLRMIQNLQNELAELKVKQQREAGAQIGIGEFAHEQAQKTDQRLRRALYERIRGNGDRAMIRIHTTEDPKRNWAVPVWYGEGRTRHIPRGQDVWVNAAELEVLDNARETIRFFEMIGEEKVERFHDRLIYPYTILTVPGGSSASVSA